MAVHDDPPPGYRFRPDTEQLLVHYLRPKLDGEDFPEGLVPFCDLYGDQEPWEIWENFNGTSEKDKDRKDLYFITQNKIKTLKSRRKSRTIGKGGTWKGQDAAKNVLSASWRVIGKRRRFHYEKTGSEASEHNARWLMHEFELDASLLRDKRKAKDYVLCILRKNDKPAKDPKEEGQEGKESEDVDNGDDLEDEDHSDHHEPDFVKQPVQTSSTTQITDLLTLNQAAKQFEEYLKKKIAVQATKK
ncbi:NAC domain-containing protein JA2-like [Argentina anserina]|uniref:NAC domain-containing protein JA2-like n=1 Tax=Argentina anserina TaxID=57926 RepID=UPI0021769200|nr:NAC domain-containing protein JA2-like [Potentilla anserina]